MKESQLQSKQMAQRAVAFVVVRLSSSRFPAKQLRTIGDRPLLSWVVDNLRKCRELDGIVIATVAEPANQPLRQFARKRGIDCFWYEGEVDHVTTRLRLAAEAHASEICVLVSGDCPLVYAPAIDQMVHKLKIRPEADIVRVRPDEKNRPAALQGVMVARRRAWQLADDLADRPELKEHQFPVIGLRADLFPAEDLKLPADLYMVHHRLSVDTLADLAFMNRVYDALEYCNQPFELPQVVKLLQEKPSLKLLNAHVHQRRLAEDIRQVLMVIDAGGVFGYGHLMRSLELGLQIVERQGWPVTFVVDDRQAKDLAEDHGFRVNWGAFARPTRMNGNQADSADIFDMLENYDLLVLDIFDLRGPQPGWRSKSGVCLPTVVVENLQPWAREADLIILPNLLGKEARATDPQNGDRQIYGRNKGGARVIGGKEYLILRRSIREAQKDYFKDIDLLVYLHDPELRQEVASFVRNHRLKAKILDAFDPDFPNLLARSKLFLSGFGISFHEALVLRTLPVCWPDSAMHRRDAMRFYRQLNLPVCIVNSVTDLEPTLLPLLGLENRCPHLLADGTAAIVDEMAHLVKTA